MDEGQPVNCSMWLYPGGGGFKRRAFMGTEKQDDELGGLTPILTPIPILES